ncbi:T9SS type A sorting domain-containing protein [Chitinophagaceae bacterium LB-8]|uniref:T9SS type A sorting domain-containing protein n=1 Tax=Paraflavisolibacter caeni TaxID=2982496 RepID=A0A9X2XRY4_9BACT|nr:T9SS type A sorting domain-containing protein [Paraflavisolibacter caeni]MCU7547485.1 T9SS type A sorting domain-containing protein [Paraflavisolibacter caeni]
MFLLVSIITQAQTPGLIVRPAGGPYNSVLDKNQDGFTSPTNSGFVTNDVGTGYSEIPYKVVPPFKLEPTSDLMRGPNTLFSDLVRISNDESGMYIFNDGTNMLFRLRLGSIISGSKGYSILIDADGLFGPSGPYADPNYKPATTGINGNPGFELEVVLETNFRVAIYDVDGKDDAGTTAYKTFPINSNSQISIAYSAVSGDPDYLYDFYVPLADLQYAGGTKSVTATTPIRVSATTVMSPQASIGGPKSDIYGYDGNDYMKAWESIINGQPAFTPNDVLSTGSGITSTVCTAAPTLNSSIGTGTVTVTGTWTQADATRPSSAIITLYKNGTSVGTTTVSTGGTWSISGVTSASGDVFYAKAQASGESSCLQSNSVTALGCLPSNMSSVSSITLTCASNRGFDGTAPANAVVRVYTVTSSGYTLFADQTTTTYKIDRPGASTRWTYDNVNTNSSNPCSGGQADVTVGEYAVTIQEPGKCESDYYYFYNDNNGCPSTTATPIITQATLYTGNTTISGTATSGATVRLFINGQLKSTTTATGGNYSFTTSSLASGDIVDVYAHSSGSCVSAKATRTVVCFTAPPIITTNSTGNLVNGTLISGTSTEATGTTIRLYNSANTLLATVTVQSGGTWTTSVSAATGTSYYATAQNGTCGVSTASATVSALAATTICPTITGSYNDASTSVSGSLSASFTGTVRLYQDGTLAGSASVTNATSWTITPTANTLYPGGVLTTTTQSSTGAEKTDCSGSVNISCSAPNAPSVSPTTVTVGNANGKTTFNISGSQSGVLYTLEDMSGVDKSTSVFGNSGTISVTSYAFLTPGTYNLRISALKLSGSNCGTSTTAITLTVSDNDGDGIADVVDIDDDNDGILDSNETATYDATGDADGDGVLNYKDTSPGSGLPSTDANSDGVVDAYDTDKDGIINQFDLDSDNDGIPDLVEAGGFDTNGDGKVDYTGTFASNDADNDGLINIYDATAISNLDTDGDGIKNFLDLDSDNDGIPDVVEAGGTDANNDGKLDATAIAGWDSNGDGLANAVTGSSNALIITGADGNNDGKPDSYPKANLDGKGLPNPYDLDSDDDGIVDAREANVTDSDSNGIVDGVAYGGTDANGWSNLVDGTSGGTALNIPNTDGVGGANYLDIDSDNDGISDNVEGQATASYQLPTGSDSDGDGIDNQYDNFVGYGGLGIVPVNTDGTDNPDYTDLNSDNDVDLDIVEGNDFNGNGKADDNVTLSGIDTDGDGLDDIFESAVNNGPIVTIAGFGGAGGKSPAQKTLSTSTERDWRNSLFALSTYSVLPVHFVSISATKNSHGVQVVWTVSDEQNVKVYEVEKSINGSRYTKIGEVAFKTTNDAIKKYQFLDASPVGNTAYYRIRQVDHDSKFMFSSVVSISATETGSKLSVHPNPVYSEASIVIGVKEDQKTMYVLSDMQGKILIRNKIELLKGQNVIPADSFRRLLAGTYVLMVQADGGVLQTKFIKQ